MHLVELEVYEGSGHMSNIQLGYGRGTTFGTFLLSTLTKAEAAAGQFGTAGSHFSKLGHAVNDW